VVLGDIDGAAEGVAEDGVPEGFDVGVVVGLAVSAPLGLAEGGSDVAGSTKAVYIGPLTMVEP
jgi:hypothetical protein